MAMMRRYRQRFHGGYTLLELMIVVAIVGTVTIIAAKIFTGLYDFYTISMARIEIQRDLRTTLDSINRNLRQADADTVIVSQEGGSSPYSKVYFIDISRSTHTYKQQGRSLYHTQDNRTRLLTKNVEYVAFTYPRTDINTVMSVSITLKKKTVKGQTTALQMAISKVRIMN